MGDGGMNTAEMFELLGDCGEIYETGELKRTEAVLRFCSTVDGVTWEAKPVVLPGAGNG